MGKSHYHKKLRKARKEALRHADQLRSAIWKYGPQNFQEKKRLLRETTMPESRHLKYINPWAAIRWQNLLLESFQQHGFDPDECTKVTVIHEAWNTNDQEWSLKFFDIKNLLEEAFSGIPFFGMIEFAFFQNVRHGHGRLIAVHFEGILLKTPSRRAMARVRKHFDGSWLGAKGVFCKRIFNFEGALRYSVKLPSYGYRHIPKYPGRSSRNPSVRMYFPTHYALFKNLQHFTFPDLTVAGGDGFAVYQMAINIAKRNGFNSSQKLSASGQVKPTKYLKERQSTVKKKLKSSNVQINHYYLSGDGGINSKVEYPRRKLDVSLWVKKCVSKHRGSAMISRGAKRLRYEFFQEIYTLSLNAWDKQDELVALAKNKKLSFNHSTDIFAFVLKVVYGDKGQSRRLVSEHASALRYLHYLGVNADVVADKLSELGGIRKCCRAFARHRRLEKKLQKDHSKSHAKKHSASQALPKFWSDIKTARPVAKFKKSKGDLARGRYAMLGYMTKSGELRIYKAFSIKGKPGSQMLFSAQGS